MSILTHRAPSTITVCGHCYEIRTNFRVGILAEQMLLDGEVEQPGGISRLLHLYLPTIPPQWEEAAPAVLWFYSAGQSETTQQTQSLCNAAHIYAAFLTDYGIDLETVE